MRSTFVIFTLCLSVVACGQPANQPAAPADSAPPASAPQTAPAGPALIEGLGPLHHRIRTTSREAQAWFDQGMSLVFAFNHEEAVRSFERAAQLDPTAAMPHWGIAWAVGPNYNLDVDDPRAKQAFEAISKAQTLAASGPETERAYVRALAVRYSNDPKADRSPLQPGHARSRA
jgi:tetratricopeptide (TPR) repeat protein